MLYIKQKIETLQSDYDDDDDDDDDDDNNNNKGDHGKDDHNRDNHNKDNHGKDDFNNLVLLSLHYKVFSGLHCGHFF